MTARSPVLAGNWKMNLGPSAAAGFFTDFLVECPRRDDRIVLFFPPALSLAAARAATEDRPDIRLGVQNVYWEPDGAFTGELSVAMAADAGAQFALVGHSERRHLFGETITQTVRKVRAVLDGGLVPVLCVGEKIEERRAGRAEAVVDSQLGAVLSMLSVNEAERFIVAYEPVWAIGTGETATAADAGAMHASIRARLDRSFGRAVGGGIPILYGGSVKPENAAELLAEPEVGGVLVGGASLDPRGFASICASAG
ncbi:MAG TPA: triose-phosphate isomerase [Longimicrobium sp.]|nr:triose-phosphate isomerase [Longimicrobium sp.]